MSVACKLIIEQKPTPQARQLFESYYFSLLKAKGEEFIAKRWQEIVNSSNLVFYKINIDAVPAGWIIFNSRNSTIVEFFIDQSYNAGALEALVLDKVVERHKLISAELPESDLKKYELLIAYGLRPTRHFTLYKIPMLRMDLSTAIYLEKIKDKAAAPYPAKEVVGLEKIAETQTGDEIKQGLENLIDNLGGLRKFVKNGQTVVLKPNIVSDHGLRQGVKKGGITTDIRLVKAMVELLAPVAGRIIIAEGSSINRSDTMKMFIHYGFDKIIDSFPQKVSLVDLNSDECLQKNIPDGRRLQERAIPKTLLEADVIINMPVLKLHFAAGASLSIKNFQGAIPPLEKYKAHFFGLWQNLINTYKTIRPDLIIIDGLYGQEGFGPVSGTAKKMDILIGGTNPVAVDSVALKIMGLKVEDSPPVLMAHHEGLGPIDADQIEVRGTSIDEVSSPFKRPLINLNNGKCFKIHDGAACPGCRGYLHFVLNKLRRPDPKQQGRQLIDRPFKKNVNVFIGPHSADCIDPDEINIFMGICRQHQAGSDGRHLPGCPPHAEEIINGIYSLYPDLERPQYADQTEESKLGELLRTILDSQNLPTSDREENQ